MKKMIQIGVTALAVGGIATWATLALVHRRNEQTTMLRLERIGEQVDAEMHHRFSRYEVALRSLQGLFHSSKQVDEDEFQSMAQSLAAVELPGFVETGFIQQVIDQNQEKHLVKYVSGYDETQLVVGQEYRTSPERTSAIQRAKESRNSATLIEEESHQLTILMPVFDAKSVTHTVGIVFLTIDLNSFSHLTSTIAQAVCYSLTAQDDGQPSRSYSLAKSSCSGTCSELDLHETRRPRLFGTPWLIDIEPTAKLTEKDELLEKAIVVGGAILTLLFAASFVVWRADVRDAQALTSKLNDDMRRLAMVAERTTNAVVLTGTDRKICWVNDGFTRITGYSFEEALGKSPGSLLQFSKTDPNTIQQLRQSLRNGKGFCGEILNRSKDGREYWVYTDIQPLVRDDGTHLGFLAIESDVTELKRTTEALAEAKAQTECALDGGKLSIWHWNLREDSLHLDQRFFQIAQLGQQQFDQPSSYLLDRIHPEDVANFQSVISDCIKGAHAYFEVEFRLRNEAGQYLWMMSRGRTSSMAKTGDPQQLMGTLVEITDRKNAEFALRESEARASAVFNHSIDAILILDELTIVDCNPPAVAMFGFSQKQELLGRHINSLTPEVQSSGRSTIELAAEISQIMEATGQARFEWTHLKPDGSKFETDVSYSNLEIVGKIVQLAIVRDISKKKELERQLSQAQKLESIGQLAAGIAHEVNTPMQCVFSNVEFLKSSLTKIFSLTNTYRTAINANSNDCEIEKVRLAENECRFDALSGDCMDAVVESADASNRVIEIVRAMKTMSHPGTTQKSNINLNKLIKDASIISRNRWKYVANFKLELDESIGDVPVLPAQMSQVLLNLIVNAADAIVDKIGPDPLELGTITARTKLVDSGALIEICDTGTGMDEKTKLRVFDPFFTTKDVGKGTGQGLAIAYDVVVRQHRGRFSVDSTLGLGSTFQVWLPLEPSNANPLSHINMSLASGQSTATA